jgi:hypothetical protein
MPNYQEYENILYAEAQSIMTFPADTRTDIDKHAAEARRRVTRKRNELTGGITKAWKDGFARLKAENDQMQKDLAQAHKDVDQKIHEQQLDQYVGLRR